MTALLIAVVVVALASAGVNSRFIKERGNDCIMYIGVVNVYSH